MCSHSILIIIQYFFIRSKRKLKLSYVTDDGYLGIYHQYDERNIRILFHQGRILILSALSGPIVF